MLSSILSKIGINDKYLFIPAILYRHELLLFFLKQSYSLISRPWATVTRNLRTVAVCGLITVKNRDKKWRRTNTREQCLVHEGILDRRSARSKVAVSGSDAARELVKRRADYVLSISARYSRYVFIYNIYSMTKDKTISSRDVLVYESQAD